MIILMRNDKSLVITKSSKIYRQENIVDKLTIYVPVTYEDADLTRYTAQLVYVDGAYDVHTEELIPSDTSDKEGYIQFVLPITTAITNVVGEVAMHLNLSYTETDMETGEETNYVLRTGKASFNVLPWTDSFSLGN